MTDARMGVAGEAEAVAERNCPSPALLGAGPSPSDREPWLGHRDLCSLQWSPICDCDPNNPIDFSEPEVSDE